MTERVIKVVLDDREVNPKLKRMEGNLGRVEKQSDKTSKGFKLMAVAAATAVTALGIRKFVQYGDELIRLQNRLGTVTDSTGNLRTVQAELVELSFRTRTAFEDNVELFTRAAAATEALGLSQRTVIELTESLSTGLRIGGATAAEASGVLTQFTQGLALGRFETQELKSVLEQSVPISRALQKEFQATQGELLKLAETGKLAADRVVTALTGDTLEDFRRQLDKLGVAADEGFGQLGRATKLALGELNIGLGLSSALGEAFNDMAVAIAGNTEEFFLFGDALRTQGSIRIAQLVGIIKEAGLEFDNFANRAKFGFAVFFQSDQPELFEALAAEKLAIEEALADVEKETEATIDQILSSSRARIDEFLGGRGLVGDDDDGTDVPGPDPAQVKDATTFLADLREEIERAKIETMFFGEEAEAALLRFEAAQNIEENVGALADEINDATEALIAQNIALARQEELRENQADDADLIASLEEQVELIGLHNEELERQTNLQELSADATDLEREKVEELTDAIAEGDREEFIASLERELELVKLGDEEREVEIALRELGAEATLEQQEAVKRLTEELIKERDELDEFQKAVESFSEDVGDALADTLFDGLRDGFDDVEDEFANFLQNLAKQLIASQLTDLLVSLLENLGGGTSGAIGGFISAVAGRQTGGEAIRGVPISVGETRPEIFVPSESGNILPDASSGLGMAPIIQNILDPENQLALIETARGRNVIRNTIQGDLDFYERILGQK